MTSTISQPSPAVAHWQLTDWQGEVGGTVVVVVGPLAHLGVALVQCVQCVQTVLPSLSPLARRLFPPRGAALAEGDLREVDSCASVTLRLGIFSAEGSADVPASCHQQAAQPCRRLGRDLGISGPPPPSVDNHEVPV